MSFEKTVRLLIQRRFWWRVLQDFWLKRGMDSAAILAYTSLVAIVPALALMLSLFSLSDWFVTAQQFVLNGVMHHLLPDAKPLIERYIWQFSQQAAQLRGVGLLTLFVMTLILLWTIDERLNLVWENRLSRRWWVTLSHYLGVSLLGPLLLGASIVLSSYVFALPWLVKVGEALPWIEALGGRALSFAVGVLGFWFLYRYAPRHSVSGRAAMVGAILAMGSLEGLRWGFGLYIRWFPTYDVIYGAFAAVPLFLLWLYLVWWVVIFNAHVVYQLDQFPLKTSKGKKR